MSRFILPLLVLGLVGACGDEPTKESPVPKVAAKPAAAATQTPAATAATKKVNTLVGARAAKPSTVCTRYRARLAAAQRVPTPKAKITSLQTLVADACQ